MSQKSDEAMLKELQQNTFNYFLCYGNEDNGLIADSSRQDSPVSITAVGLTLGSYPVAVERGFLSRQEAVDKTLRALRFFWQSPQGPEPNATGYKGFYYHFLDMDTGRRAINSELSTIDTTFLIVGAFTAAQYFDRDTAEEQEIRQLADNLYRRLDWEWVRAGRPLVSHGWRPEEGFLKGNWEGYTEALLLYVLALASP
ncbi:MAG TPA: hypothetical protein VF177_11485, partial [Anaerolineae bacterium]